MASAARVYLERMISERQREQIATEEVARTAAAQVLVQECDLDLDAALDEIDSYVATYAGDIDVAVQIPLRSELRDTEKKVEHVELLQDYGSYRTGVLRELAYQHLQGHRLRLGLSVQDWDPTSAEVQRSVVDLGEALEHLLPQPETTLTSQDWTDASDMAILKEKYVEALIGNPQGFNRVELANATSTNHRRWRPLRDRVLNYLLHLGTVVRIGTDKRGRYYHADHAPAERVREDHHAREIYETIHQQGPLAFSTVVRLVGNDSPNGRDRARKTIGFLVEQNFIQEVPGPRGYVHYSV